MSSGAGITPMIPDLFNTHPADIYSVTELSQNIKQFFSATPQFNDILLKGEISKIAQDKDFADVLQKHLKDMRPQVDIIMKMKVGENVVGIHADEMIGGKANINIDIEQAKDVTGARIRRIG